MAGVTVTGESDDSPDGETCSTSTMSGFLFVQMFTCRNLIHAFSGGIGGGLAITVCYPLETARTRLQVDDKRQAKSSYKIVSNIVQDEGFQGLFRGWWSVVVALFFTNFVYFYVFHGCKTLLRQEGVGQGAEKDLVFSVIAGVLTVFISNPFWVVNTRLKLQGVKFYDGESIKGKTSPVRYNGIIDCLRKIVRQEGVIALWIGTLPSLFLVSNPAIQFIGYEGLKRNLQYLLGREELSGLLYFMAGAIAKLFATVATYPFQIIQTRLRAQNPDTSIKDLIKSHGVLGLYRGMESKLTQTILTSALMFMIYEKVVQFVFLVTGLD